MSLLQLCHLAKAVVVRSLPSQGAGKNQIHSDSADILPEKVPEPMSQNSRLLSVQMVDEHPSENHARYCLNNFAVLIGLRKSTSAISEVNLPVPLVP